MLNPAHILDQVVRRSVVLSAKRLPQPKCEICVISIHTKLPSDSITADNIVYVINLGDSRAVLSCNQGRTVLGLSRDHKPNDPGEEKRITENGGKIY